jgi:hypothetical protein
MRMYILGPRHDRNEWFGYGMNAPGPPMMSDLDECELWLGMPVARSYVAPSTSSLINTAKCRRGGESQQRKADSHR